MKNYDGINALAERYAKSNGVSKREAKETVKRVLESIRESLLDETNDGIQIVDFLTLEKVLRKARIGRNPRTMEEVIIPDTKGIKTTLGKTFDKTFNQ